MRIVVNIQEALEFISHEAQYEDAMSSKSLSGGNDEEHKKHFARVQIFAALNNFLEDLNKRLTPAPSQTNILPSELESLPPELIEQLSTDNQEMDFLKIIEDHDGTISLDRLILSYYKLHEVILDRRKTTAKFYRMIKSGSIYSIGGKGIYSIYEPENKDDLLE